jgi:hypothetical protein
MVSLLLDSSFFSLLSSFFLRRKRRRKMLRNSVKEQIIEYNGIICYNKAERGDSYERQYPG